MGCYEKHVHQQKEVAGRESKEDASNSKGLKQQHMADATARIQKQQGNAATTRSRKQQEFQQQEKPAKGGVQATVTAGKSVRF